MLLGGSFVTSDERAKFRLEAEAVARLRHSNIVQIYEVGETKWMSGCPGHISRWSTQPAATWPAGWRDGHGAGSGGGLA